jgi:hypothetical protein
MRVLLVKVSAGQGGATQVAGRAVKMYCKACGREGVQATKPAAVNQGGHRSCHAPLHPHPMQPMQLNRKSGTHHAGRAHKQSGTTVHRHAADGAGITPA